MNEQTESEGIANRDVPSGFPDSIKLTRILLSTLGLTGVCAVIGYTSIVARQELLGIHSDPGGINEISLKSGEFYLDTILLTLNQFSTHWLLTTIAILATGLLLWFPSRIKHRSVPLRRALPLTSTVLSFLVGFSGLTIYELPTIRLRDSMILDLCAQPGVGYSNFIGRRTNQLWSLILDSKGSTGQQLNCTSNYGSKLKHYEEAEANESLADGYILAIAMITGGWILALSAGTRRNSGVMRCCQYLTLVILIVGTLLLPYVYGKLIASTKFGVVNVSYAPPNETHAKWLAGYLVSEDEKEVVILAFEAATSQLIELRRDQINELDLSGRTDVIRERIKSWRLKAPISEGNKP